MRRLVLALGIVLLLGLTGPAVAGSVRVPRDSPIVIHGRVLPAGSVELSNVRPATRRPATAPAACRAELFPDPGYRPLWVPDTTCWTGLETRRVPGHWQGP